LPLRNQHLDFEISKKDTLSNLNFDIQLLGSQKYLLNKLENLTEQQTQELKAAFAKNKYPRFKKELSGGKKLSYGYTSSYLAKLSVANSEKLSQLRKLTGMLMQSKIYLFWTHLI
jgi:hypothetical protein